ncbi:MAG: hypothetical protein KA313_02010 [Pseudarcicella sp.]|nr:hypothetical protein [Pseudarcicella sp.]MBP6409853.1 hypothetical protein [Pseudarcicella sp.]
MTQAQKRFGFQILGNPKMLFATGIALCLINSCSESTSIASDVQPTSSVNSNSARKIVDSVLTFDRNENISTYKVEAKIAEIVINDGVTITGNIVVPDNRTTNLIIRGQSQNRSILLGSLPADRGVHGIDATNFSKKLILKNFTSKNPAGYHMRALKAPVIANHVSMIDDTGCTTCNTDGFSGGDGSIYTDCYLNTNDDSFKVYYGNYTIKNTTIVHNKNGSPIQNGWSDTKNGNIVTIDNVTIQHNSTSYNQGVIAFAGNSNTGAEAATDKISRTFKMVNGGLKFTTNVGKTASPLYSFGTNGNSVSNKTYFIQGNNCSSYAKTTSNTKIFNNSENNKVTTCQ